MNDAFRWNDWNRDHIAVHGVSAAEAEYVVNHAAAPYPEQIGDDKMSKRKPYWQMTTAELAKATKQFDDPSYDPPAIKPTAKQASQLRRWRRKGTAEQSKLTLSLEQDLIEHADEYAASHGMTFSELVSNALRRWMRKRSA